MAVTMQVRRGTAAAWTSANPTLAAGEWGFETDTYKFKIGDGVTAWTSRPYYVSAVASHTHSAADLTSGTLDIARIADGSLTLAKLANLVQATVMGRAAGAGTGVPTALTAAQLVAIITGADGAGSGLDADLLDGYSSADFPRKAEAATISGAWTFGAAVTNNGTDTASQLSGFSVLPRGYQYPGINFRFDQSQTAWLFRTNNLTYTITAGTDPGSAAVFQLFDWTNNYINLNTYKNGSNTWGIEVTGFSLSNSSNTNWRPYVVWHSANQGNVLIELLAGDNTTWVTAYNGAANAYTLSPNATTIAPGVLKGVRFTFSGITGNAYLKMVGAMSLTSDSFAWQMLKGGGDFYGTVNWKALGTTHASITAAGVASLASLGVSGAATVGGTLTGSSTIQGTRFISTQATGTAPLTVSSTTVVANLNADLFEGQHGSFYQDAANLNAGSIPSARVPAGAVTQHQAALSIAATQITGQLAASQMQPFGWTLTKPGSYPVTPTIQPRRTPHGWTGHISAKSLRGSSGTVYYVDVLEGDNANSGTSSAAPLKSIEIALEKADVGTVKVAPGIYRWGDTWGAPTFSISATASYRVERWPVRAGEVYITDALAVATWTADGTYPHVYYAASTFSERVVDLDVPLPDGGFYTYGEASSLAKCSTQPGTWWWDSTNNRAYINPLRRGVPSDSILVLRGFNAAVDSGARRTIYLDGLTFMSGAIGFLASNNGSTGGQVVARRCRFLNCVSTGCQVSGYATSVMEDCVAAQNLHDGWSYVVNGSNKTTNAVEVRCGSFWNGVSSYPDTVNGSSIHTGMAITRIGCRAWGNLGPQYADVGSGTYAWLVGCYAGQSAAFDEDEQSSGFQFNTGTTAWLYECESRSNLHDLSIGASTTVYRDRCEFAVETNAGTMSTFVQG